MPIPEVLTAVAIVSAAGLGGGIVGFRLGSRSDGRYDIVFDLLDHYLASVVGTARRLADRLAETRVRGDVEESFATDLERLMEQIAAEGAPAQAFQQIVRELGPDLSSAPRVPRAKQPPAQDQLTGLRDRRGYEAELEREIARARRTKRPLAVAVFDLGDLSQAQVRSGHTAVDGLLQDFGALLARVTRVTDTVCRPGAAHFGVLLPETTETAARLVRGRIRNEVAAWDFGKLGPITFSSGIAEWRPDESAETFGARAFAALRSVGSLSSNRA